MSDVPSARSSATSRLVANVKRHQPADTPNVHFRQSDLLAYWIRATKRSAVNQSQVAANPWRRRCSSSNWIYNCHLASPAADRGSYKKKPRSTTRWENVVGKTDKKRGQQTKSCVGLLINAEVCTNVILGFEYGAGNLCSASFSRMHLILGKCNGRGTY